MSIQPAGSDWQKFAERLTPERRLRMEAVAEKRTQWLRLVIQDVHNPHNVSACMRSAEAFGVSQVDVVELKNRFRPSTVARGVDKWLQLNRHNSVQECMASMPGVRVAAGMPSPDAGPMEELPLDQPLAVVFGNEQDGVSDEWRPYVDHYFTIPMAGIVESMNISVCAAVTMHHLSLRGKKELPPENWYVNEEEKRKLLDRWIRQHNSKWAESSNDVSQ